MDKLLRRTRMAERQVSRRAKAIKRIEYETEFKQERIRSMGAQGTEVAQQRKLAIRARHEKWALGPLSPRLDTPKFILPGDDEPVLYGSISGSRTKMASSYTKAELERSAAWAGGLKKLCLAVGDRVVVMEGPSKGRISQVTAIDKENASVTLKNLAKTNTTLPMYLQEQANGKVAPLEAQIPIAAVRLVHPLQRPNGEMRDVIIRKLEPVDYVFDRVTRKAEFDRLVPGPNVKIPWPDEPEEKHTDHECDTLRIDVEERTFVPTLTRPPMPSAVLDELRNRYSKFRTRHTDEYIAEKEAEEAAKEARRRSPKTMMTPVEEFNRQQREMRRARGQPVLTDEMLEKIGEVMAKNLAARGQGARVGAIQDAVKNLSIGESGASATKKQPPPS